MRASEAITKLKSFLLFEEGWDSYGATPADHKAINNAIKFILDTSEEIYYVGLTRSGDAIVELFSKGRDEFDNYTFNEDGLVKHLFIQRKLNRVIQKYPVTF